MKIGVFTQPLRKNYGGILQNWALQQVLIMLGHDPITIKYRREKITTYKKCRHFVRSLAAYCVKFFLRHPSLPLSSLPWQDKPNDNLLFFIKRNIKTNRSLKKVCYNDLLRYGIDLVIVGSDQVWRPKYNIGCLDVMFCEFMPEDSKIPAIVYGGSFGTNSWEYTVEETNRYKASVRKFTSVSMREKSGVDLCQKYFDKDSRHVLDPTLLLSCSKYRELHKKNPIKGHINTSNKVAVYVLDLDTEKKELIDNVCERLHKEPVYIGVPNDKTYERPSIESWLKSIDECDYLITDSFHGSVFSIIFHKPFLSIINPERGSDRFLSLLNTFDLTERIAHHSDADLNYNKITSPIDWENVDTKKDVMAKDSLKFLTESINITQLNGK